MGIIYQRRINVNMMEIKNRVRKAMCVFLQRQRHNFFENRQLRMLLESLTHEQRNKNTIFVRYLLVGKPEKK